ncbi:CehA/McbA family metallohydrolase [Paenibacillus aceris]|uniref:Roadblock/LC7 domain-containing protein n=1 Tax=Paenibacillus aceris TaxID=869555 RepID=A0ABS4HZR9_9BACL|nr:CehA/McbA family metallohydrolase [Paenibacillus aceris]MBP1964153.1 roadblock/LC7 domain-containing protein [Paenibacillus aceris]NHW36484.1 CehA/McbA family metallohydrolase [Paenibacillus aceris]
MPWIACELHSHTFHSDGKQTLIELANGAKALGFECIALTDHNTMTGLNDKHVVEQETGISIISGMEWTTFYGHMVTIGLPNFVDWRLAGPNNIHKGIAEVHSSGGIVGMAHPFRIGSPICTGCYWEFNIEDWNAIDYIEVWSGTFPSIKTDNERAYRLWTDKLNEGYKIAATSGRDWHAQEHTDEPVSVTYLDIDDGEETLTQRAVRALSEGKVSVTLGPLVSFSLRSEAAVYGIGDCIPVHDQSHSYKAHISIDYHVRKGLWNFPKPQYTLILIGNSGVLSEQIVIEDQPNIVIEIPGDELLWIRAELRAIVRGVRTLVAFTNAIYADR